MAWYEEVGKNKKKDKIKISEVAVKTKPPNVRGKKVQPVKTKPPEELLKTESQLAELMTLIKGVEDKAGISAVKLSGKVGKLASEMELINERIIKIEKSRQEIPILTPDKVFELIKGKASESACILHGYCFKNKGKYAKVNNNRYKKIVATVINLLQG